MKAQATKPIYPVRGTVILPAAPRSPANNGFHPMTRSERSGR
ncbi:hypothetical protein I546_5413 [Mycobacterium kansasii 732]|nr:hypothetical protein I546_5413 [Mycobacterium kansasii 732]